jgi:hypothetical protein
MSYHNRSKYIEFPSSGHRPSIALSALHAARKEVVLQKTRIGQRSFEKCSSKIMDLTMLSVCAAKERMSVWEEGLKKARKAKNGKEVKEALRLANKAVEIRVRSIHVD